MSDLMDQHAEEQHQQTGGNHPIEFGYWLSEMPFENENAGGEEQEKHVQPHMHTAPLPQTETPSRPIVHGNCRLETTRERNASAEKSL
jgi:hypothetical protein